MEESETIFDTTIFWHSDESLSDEEEAAHRKKVKEERRMAVEKEEEEQRLLIESGVLVPEIEYEFKSESFGGAGGVHFQKTIKIKQDTRKCCGGKVWDSVSRSGRRNRKNKINRILLIPRGEKQKGIHDLRFFA